MNQRAVYIATFQDVIRDIMSLLGDIWGFFLWACNDFKMVHTAPLERPTFLNTNETRGKHQATVMWLQRADWSNGRAELYFIKLKMTAQEAATLNWRIWRNTSEIPPIRADISCEASRIHQVWVFFPRNFSVRTPFEVVENGRNWKILVQIKHYSVNTVPLIGLPLMYRH